ncbi:MAG: hypothetical protein MJB57_01895 [Gemmatimonadetes bacterium]|nr:hypothetical protein [Gemmatimonadota bacterium]
MMKRTCGRGQRGLPLAACGLAVAAAFVTTAARAEAQTPVSTVYEREVFTYPSFGRRDPFRPLNAGEQLGPRFEDLTLTGVLYNPTIGSVATLIDDKTGRRYRSREGDALGEIRVAAIRSDEVDFVITSFGISRRETLTVKKNKEIEG